MSFRNDTRALGLGIVAFVAVLAIGAFLFILLTPAIDQLVSTTTDQASTQQTQNQIDLANEIWGYVLFYALFLAGLFIVVRSVWESRSVR